MPTRTAAFDRTAADYDCQFSHRTLGRWLRESTWDYLREAFQPGDHVLDLGCGTGEDALMLARQEISVTGIDVSGEMVNVARQKSIESGLSDLVTCAKLDLTDLRPARLAEISGLKHGFKFDGAYSNFGALNCLSGIPAVASELADMVTPGGRVILVLMGPMCLWEITWHLIHGKARQAFRRLQGSTVANAGQGEPVRVWYHTSNQVIEAFSEDFAVLQLAGVGFLLPPSYLAEQVDRHPQIFSSLHRAELKLREAPLVPLASDHYLIVLQRKETPVG